VAGANRRKEKEVPDLDVKEPAPGAEHTTPPAAERTTPPPAQPSGHICPADHAGWLSTSLRKLVNNPRRILKGLVSEGDTAVDLGCGPGFFTLPLAQMVGETGRVIAIDVQEEMLAKLRARAEKARLASRIQLHLTGATSLGVAGPADFALAFYMVHEVPDRERFFRETYGFLKEGGRFLLVEPNMHVSEAEFRRTVEAAGEAGFVVMAQPRIAFSRATLFRRP
jgi:ubiquinone/menaquinone biosynthesis C-methylase UbiE